MRAVLLLTVLGLLMFGCGGTMVEDTQTPLEAVVDEHNIRATKIFRGTITVLEIEGCEYIIYDWFDVGNIVHKNNCKFCNIK